MSVKFVTPPAYVTSNEWLPQQPKKCFEFFGKQQHHSKGLPK